MKVPDPTADRRSILWVASLLALLTAGCYWPIAGHSFISFYDPQYITLNPHIQSGLTWEGVAWAFGSGYASNWHPATWLSHMLDVELFGMNAGGHHLTALVLHALNSVLLLLWLRQLTGTTWRGAAVAALFALHPLHVESVAWASERKDLLSTAFLLLTLLAYTRFARESCRKSYALALAFFALGLMSKPMLVTVPCILLLLDFWPLRRFQAARDGGSTWGTGVIDRRLAGDFLRLSVEKIPFAALALADSVITFNVQDSGGAMPALSHVGLAQRMANCAISYCRYMWKTFWPADLCLFYPLPAHWPGLWVAGAAVAVAGISAVVLWQAFRRPHLFVGWFWFVGTLVPAIGLVQVGAQSMADRYMYIPSIGLFIALAWSMAEMWRLKPRWRRGMSCAGIGALAACFYLTSVQVAYWQTPVTVFARAVQVVPDNYLACNALGKAFEDAGKVEDALAFYDRALRLAPGFVEARYNLGTLLLQAGNAEAAVQHLSQAVSLDPVRQDARINLGTALLRLDRIDLALEQLEMAVQLNPGDANTRYTLGLALSRAGRAREAAETFQAAIRLNPSHAGAQQGLGAVLAAQGQFERALMHFEKGVRLSPQDAELRFNFGLAFLDAGRPEEAVGQFRAALHAGLKEARTHYRLGLALSRSGDVPGALEQFREALRLNPDFPEARKEIRNLESPQSLAAGRESAL